MATYARIKVATALAAVCLGIWWLTTLGEAHEERNPHSLVTAGNAPKPPLAGPKAEETAFRTPSADSRTDSDPVPSQAISAQLPAPQPVATFSTPLERTFYAVTDTFFTEEPDVAGLLSLSSSLADAAIIAADETHPNAGKLQIGAELTGSFSVDAQGYKIDLVARDPAAHCRRALSITFSEEASMARNARITVNSYPDKDPSNSIAGAELVGWRATIDPEAGAKLYRTTTTIEDPAPASKSYMFQISDTPSAEPKNMPWAAGSYAFDSWLRRLPPQHAK